MRELVEIEAELTGKKRIRRIRNKKIRNRNRNKNRNIKRN